MADTPLETESLHHGLLAWNCAGAIRRPNVNPHLARIRIFPLKSLDGVAVDEAVVRRGSGLAHDREFCLVDESGNFRQYEASR